MSHRTGNRHNFKNPRTKLQISLGQFLKMTLKILKGRSNFGILEHLKKSRMSKIGNFSFCWLKRLSFLSKNFWCDSFRLSWMPSQCPPRGHISCQLCRCSKTSSSGREEWSARHLVGALSQTRYLFIWPPRWRDPYRQRQWVPKSVKLKF